MLGRNAYRIFSLFLFILIIIRFFSSIGACFADYRSLSIPLSARLPLAFIIHLPGLYGLYSVIRYFGFRRTPGEDHFRPEEYRAKPFVKQGLYRFSDNVMYTYLGLNFLALAIFCASKAGLLLTINMYATVWTHYFCTEKPDIEYIYGK